ncbi:MAG: threonine aldolase [Clostridiales bacterium]|nr:threonine aldolase [Clostridiales bacterium]
MSYSFKNDYSEGAHPSILEAMTLENGIQRDGYGEDAVCNRAAEKIKKFLDNPESEVFFLSGGTQTNLTVISAFLRPHEAAIAAETGHVLVHETGAIEATGHKVVAIPSGDGKITAEQIHKVVLQHEDEHMVKPKLVYISNPTEIGTVYTREEILALKTQCALDQLLLYVDGARLGSALAALEGNLTLADLSELTDAFYIGGTKNGAWIGEALVINRESLQEDFRYHMKQKGALLAKGRLIGIQFDVLFTDGLYVEVAKHANRLAQKMRKALAEEGYEFLTDSPTNQIFPILPVPLIQTLSKDFGFFKWAETAPGFAAIRLVTSWATPESAVDAFIEAVKKNRQ